MFISLQGLRVWKMLILPHKKSLKRSSWIKEGIQAMDDQNVDFGEALFDEDLNLK